MEALTYGSGSVEVVVLPEAGARLHRLRVLGHDLLRTPPDPTAHMREPFSWGSYVMAPWCNRIDAEPVSIGGRRVKLLANFTDGSAIHGQVYARAWEPLADAALRVRAGGDAWPWEYEVTQRIVVDALSVRFDLALTNRSTDPMPAGLGIHPWFRKPVEVAIRGDAVHRSNTVSRPLPEPVQGAFDRRRIGELAPDLDATWTQLAAPPVRLRWPGAGITASMRVWAPSVFIVAASPADLDAVAVEPQTHAPQGLRRMLRGEPGALAMLGPEVTMTLRVDLAFSAGRRS